MEVRVNNTKIRVLLEDISKIETDLLINWTVPKLNGGGPSFFKIHEEGSSVIYRDCQRILASTDQHEDGGALQVGYTAITTAGRLPALAIIHGVVPDYRREDPNQLVPLLETVLNNVWVQVISYNQQQLVSVITIPQIPEVIFGPDREKAATVMISSLINFTANFNARVINIVCDTQENLDLYKNVLYQNTTTSFDRFLKKWFGV